MFIRIYSKGCGSHYDINCDLLDKEGIFVTFRSNNTGFFIGFDSDSRYINQNEHGFFGNYEINFNIEYNGTRRYCYDIFTYEADEYYIPYTEKLSKIIKSVTNES